MHATRRAAVVAAILALVGAAPVSAASVSSAETLTVPSAISIGGVPASIDYGTVFPGTTSSILQYSIDLSANSSYQFRLVGSAFTDGSSTIACERRLSGFDGDAPVAMIPQSGGICATPSIVGSAGSRTVLVKLAVSLPPGVSPGTYTGTLTFEASAS